MRHLSLTRLCVFSILVVVSLAGTATAQQSVNAEDPRVRDWTVMNASSFNGTIDSAVDQCRLSASHNDTDRLGSRHCDELETALRGNTCVEQMVEDGRVHDLMNARVDGRSTVSPLLRKQLGRADKAQVCVLSDNITAYWYTGEQGKSCNNVAFTFTGIPMALPPVREALYESVLVCEQVPFTNVTPGHTWSTPSTLLPGCCCDPMFLGGNTFSTPSLTGSGYTTRCRIERRKIEE